MDLSELYRDIVEGSPDGLWVIDLDGRTVYANPEIARLHRIADEGLAALTVFDTLDEDGRARFRAHLERVREGRLHEHPFEVQWVRSDGTTQWMLCSETALLDDAGRPRALLRRYSDNTDRHELIASLQASEDALEDQVAQNNLMQAVATAANEATTLGDVLVHARSLVLLHDDWERARAFVPVADGSGRVEPFYPAGDRRRGRRRPAGRRGARVGPTRPRRARAGLGRGEADHRVPDPARHRGVRRRGDHLRSPAVPPRADRDHGRTGRRAAGPGRRARAGAGRGGPSPRRGDGGLSPEVGLPGHDEPRDPDAAQRRDRPQRPPAPHLAHP